MTGWARAAARVVPPVMGWLVIVALVDLGVGSLVGRGDPPEAPPPLLLAGPTTQVADNGEVDPRVDVAAYSGSPWNREYWAEFHSLTYKNVPFLPGSEADSDFPYIHMTDGVRRSYEQPDLAPDAPVVWFFGGSTVWGEGQRDLHTIPSEVARLAGEQGTALRVVNYGQRGWAHWEEMLAFERALSEGPPPAVVVFYDGVNDRLVQVAEEGGLPADDPTVYDTGAELPDAVPPPLSAPDQVSERSWSDRLLANSLLLRLAGRLGGFDTPASAAEAPDDATAVADRTIDVYERGRALSLGLAADGGVLPLFFWQPEYHAVLVGAPAEVIGRLTAPTIDITGVLDNAPQVYVDSAHTNEEGAHLVAAAMMAHVLDALSRSGHGAGTP